MGEGTIKTLEVLAGWRLSRSFGLSKMRNVDY